MSTFYIVINKILRLPRPLTLETFHLFSVSSSNAGSLVEAASPSEDLKVSSLCLLHYYLHSHPKDFSRETAENSLKISVEIGEDFGKTACEL